MSTKKLQPQEGRDLITALQSKLYKRVRENSSLRRDLQNLSDHVLIFLEQLDTAMKLAHGPDKGRKIASYANLLDMTNDSVRFSSLGVDFRTDDKAKAREKIRSDWQRGISYNSKKPQSRGTCTPRTSPKTPKA